MQRQDGTKRLQDLDAYGQVTATQDAFKNVLTKHISFLNLPTEAVNYIKRERFPILKKIIIHSRYIIQQHNKFAGVFFAGKIKKVFMTRFHHHLFHLLKQWNKIKTRAGNRVIVL